MSTVFLHCNTTNFLALSIVKSLKSHVMVQTNRTSITSSQISAGATIHLKKGAGQSKIVLRVAEFGGSNH